VGASDFRETGEAYVKIIIQLGGLKKSDNILDVGCGIGRMAVPLMTYLDKTARYEGFDIVPEGIRWCRKTITPRASNFSFKLADLYNKQYNPDGKFKASEYTFPYDDESFDFVFLGSVLTHMLPEDMKHYTQEIKRVLKENGKCFITYFLLNEETRRLIVDGKSTLDFHYELDGCFTIDPSVPERAVAYDEQLIGRLLASENLVVVDPIKYGAWSGREEYYSGQDIIRARKITKPANPRSVPPRTNAGELFV
jgi:SAM-dependent methyltransferase